MKHVTYGEKSVLMGDDAADTLLEYARLIADNGGADSVTLTSISPDGNTVETSFLLGPNTMMMVESTNSQIQPPDNEEAVSEMKDRIDAITRPAVAEPDEPWEEPGHGVTDYM